MFSALFHERADPVYEYGVCVENSVNDLTLPQNNSGPLGEEMVTTRKLEVKFIAEVKVKSTYRFEEKIINNKAIASN